MLVPRQVYLGSQLCEGPETPETLGHLHRDSLGGGGVGVVEHCGATCGGGEEERAEYKERTTSLVIIV